MKIFKNIIYAAAVMLTATACTSDVEDFFPTSSSERADQYIQNVKTVLQSAPNGWKAEYYAEVGYGGYNVFVKFNDKGEATIASEKMGDKHGAGVDDNGNLNLETSHYKIEQSMGAILSFDNNNSIFHYFAEPKNPDGYGDSGDGLAGDFEFRVITACADSVILEGKKHQSKVRMYPVKEGETWQSIYDEVQKVEKAMTARTYYVFKDGHPRDITVTLSYRCLIFRYMNEDGVAESVGVPYIVTQDGFKFYKNYTVCGLTMSGLKNGPDGQYFATNDPSIYIESQVLTPYEHLTESSWFVTYDNLGAFAQPYWDTFRTALETAGADSKKATLYWAIVGYYNGKVGFHMNAGGDYALVGFDLSTANGETGDEVKFKYTSSTTNKAGTNFYDKHKLKEALIPFIGKTKISSRTFKVTVDDARRPSYLLLTDMSEPTNVIKLLANQTYYPFGDEPLDQ